MSSTHLKSLQTINAQTLKKGLDQQSITLIDVREPAEFAREHIPGAILVSLSLFNPRKIPPTNETQLVLYCRSGNRSAVAAQKLFCCWLRASYSPLLWYCLLEGSWIPHCS